jgi:hypothetical protein
LVREQRPEPEPPDFRDEEREGAACGPPFFYLILSLFKIFAIEKEGFKKGLSLV